ncbi:hypothetical protein AXA91_27595 [Salmonella enterica]|nr:hypothetical protein [Salmonella enterica]
MRASISYVDERPVRSLLSWMMIQTLAVMLLPVLNAEHLPMLNLVSKKILSRHGTGESTC